MIYRDLVGTSIFYTYWYICLAWELLSWTKILFDALGKFLYTSEIIWSTRPAIWLGIDPGTCPTWSVLALSMTISLHIHNVTVRNVSQNEYRPFAENESSYSTSQTIWLGQVILSYQMGWSLAKALTGFCGFEFCKIIEQFIKMQFVIN